MNVCIHAWMCACGSVARKPHRQGTPASKQATQMKRTVAEHFVVDLLAMQRQ
jgi:CDGSH-type Zn-finger protein